MSTKYNRNFTNFQNISVRGSGTTSGVPNSGMIEMNAVGFAGTLAANSDYVDQSLAWTLPAKSGIVPIAGTFAVQLKGPGAAENSFSTIVTVAGIRKEDGVIVQINGGNPSTSGYDLIGANSGATAYILLSAKPNNGNITLMFYNALGATSYVNLTCSYLAFR